MYLFLNIAKGLEGAIWTKVLEGALDRLYCNALEVRSVHVYCLLLYTLNSNTRVNLNCKAISYSS